MNQELITFTHQIAMSLHRMGLAGAAVSKSCYADLGKEWAQESARQGDRLVKLALKAGMKQFVPTNDNHVREMLYEKLGYEVVSRTRKDKLPAVDKGTLKKLAEAKGKHLFIEAFLAFNAADKLLSTWSGKEGRKSKRSTVGELIQDVPGRSDTGLLHFWVFPLRARTGRRASGGGEEGDPDGRNAQNWPPKARQMIVSRWKKGKIAVADFSKLEMVLMGWRAKDEKLLEYFLNGKGYIGIAEEFWGQEVEADSKLYKATKSIVLGVGYNMKAYLMAKNLWSMGFKFSEDWDSHVRRTGKARKKYLRMFTGLRRYIRDRVAEVEHTQQVISPSGRIRHLPHHGRDSEGFWHVENAAVNQPIQCHAFGEKVLTSDLHWMSVEKLTVGQRVVGFDESPGYHQQRHWRYSIVESALHDEAVCYRITLDNGDSQTVTAEHVHLVARVSGFQYWKTTNQLCVASPNPSRLVKLLEPYEPVLSHEAGYLEGLFEGEGNVSCLRGKGAKGTALRLQFAQVPGVVLNKGVSLLKKFGFQVSICQTTRDKTCQSVYILGGKPEILHFLMLFRPERLINNLHVEELGGLRPIALPRISSIVCVGVKPIVRLQTSTHTYIVNGYATHNSFASDVTGCALVDYEEALLKEHKISYRDWHSALLEKPWDAPCSPVFNEVHDELDIDLHPKSGKRDLEILVDCMRNVRTLKKLVPEFDITLKNDVQILNNWGEAK